ncbi:hypothetical protein LWI28_026734 [Acer negundo]|uniref:Beta-galactosidase galactose-binding domain-containing protein n=1 Tax=Acer negundo TaxID=4023 RepID=A0AAD5JB24_ACENE|nr:hypothetical protein LWI28_026734 [Acer negundo]KAK4854274.1 hypothetical protein QYF36_021352 [Acer negundo]
MGKGSAWVNRHNIGRYWPRYRKMFASLDLGRSGVRKMFATLELVIIVARLTTTSALLAVVSLLRDTIIYVPCSFKDKDVNTLVLLEEFDGNSLHVSFKIVVVGIALELSYKESQLLVFCLLALVIHKTLVDLSLKVLVMLMRMSCQFFEEMCWQGFMFRILKLVKKSLENDMWGYCREACHGCGLLENGLLNS